MEKTVFENMYLMVLENICKMAPLLKQIVESRPRLYVCSLYTCQTFLEAIHVIIVKIDKCLFLA